VEFSCYFDKVNLSFSFFSLFGNEYNVPYDYLINICLLNMKNKIPGVHTLKKRAVHAYISNLYPKFADGGKNGLSLCLKS
jgi:hypothetical protein